ncbi:MAG: TatD family hydrolase [Kiritimatiellia bacterium]
MAGFGGEALMFTDTHVHFDVFAESGGLVGAIIRAQESGVSRMVAMGGSAQGNRLAVQISGEHPECIRAAVGYDRDQASLNPDFEELESLLACPGVCALGETGLDYHYHPENIRLQQDLFARMLDIGVKRSLPVVIHSREAEADTLEMLDRHPGIAAVLHCFTGGPEFARKLIERNIRISFSGILTFRNASDIAEAAAIVPDHLLLVETDTPYLAPVPFRGQRNEPAYVIETAKKLAEIRGCSLEHVAAITNRNAASLFGWENKE